MNSQDAGQSLTPGAGSLDRTLINFLSAMERQRLALPQVLGSNAQQDLLEQIQGDAAAAQRQLADAVLALPEAHWDEWRPLFDKLMAQQSKIKEAIQTVSGRTGDVSKLVEDIQTLGSQLRREVSTRLVTVPLVNFLNVLERQRLALTQLPESGAPQALLEQIRGEAAVARQQLTNAVLAQPQGNQDDWEFFLNNTKTQAFHIDAAFKSIQDQNGNLSNATAQIDGIRTRLQEEASIRLLNAPLVDFLSAIGQHRQTLRQLPESNTPQDLLKKMQEEMAVAQDRLTNATSALPKSNKDDWEDFFNNAKAQARQVEAAIKGIQDQDREINTAVTEIDKLSEQLQQDASARLLKAPLMDFLDAMERQKLALIQLHQNQLIDKAAQQVPPQRQQRQRRRPRNPQAAIDSYNARRELETLLEQIQKDAARARNQLIAAVSVQPQANQDDWELFFNTTKAQALHIEQAIKSIQSQDGSLKNTMVQIDSMRMRLQQDVSTRLLAAPLTNFLSAMERQQLALKQLPGSNEPKELLEKIQGDAAAAQHQLISAVLAQPQAHWDDWKPFFDHLMAQQSQIKDAIANIPAQAGNVNHMIAEIEMSSARLLRDASTRFLKTPLMDFLSAMEQQRLALMQLSTSNAPKVLLEHIHGVTLTAQRQLINTVLTQPKAHWDEWKPFFEKLKIQQSKIENAIANIPTQAANLHTTAAEIQTLGVQLQQDASSRLLEAPLRDFLNVLARQKKAWKQMPAVSILSAEESAGDDPLLQTTIANLQVSRRSLEKMRKDVLEAQHQLIKTLMVQSNVNQDGWQPLIENIMTQVAYLQKSIELTSTIEQQLKEPLPGHLTAGYQRQLQVLEYRNLLDLSKHFGPELQQEALNRLADIRLQATATKNKVAHIQRELPAAVGRVRMEVEQHNPDISSEQLLHMVSERLYADAMSYCADIFPSGKSTSASARRHMACAIENAGRVNGDPASSQWTFTSEEGHANVQGFFRETIKGLEQKKYGITTDEDGINQRFGHMPMTFHIPTNETQVAPVGQSGGLTFFLGRDQQGKDLMYALTSPQLKKTTLNTFDLHRLITYNQRVSKDQLRSTRLMARQPVQQSAGAGRNNGGVSH